MIVIRYISEYNRWWALLEQLYKFLQLISRKLDSKKFVLS